MQRRATRRPARASRRARQRGARSASRRPPSRAPGRARSGSSCTSRRRSSRRRRESSRRACATGFSAAARSTMSASGMSKRIATAAAASTFERFAVPGRGVRISASPIGVRTSAAVPSMPRSRTASARTSAGRSTPKVRTRPANRRRGASPGRRRHWRRAASPCRRLREFPPWPRRWRQPCRRTRDAPGRRWSRRAPRARQSSTSALISPKWFMPSSSTPMSGFALNSSSESGRPMWLFKLPLLRKTVYLADRNSAVISFVVDLPALPVTATTAAPESRRTRFASVCSAATVSGTTMSGVAARSRPPASAASLTIAPIAPFPTASTTYALPSNRSPRIAMNRSPARIVRVSIENPRSPARLPARTPARRSRRQPQPASASPLQRLARDLRFVERQLLAADRLRSFRAPCPRAAPDRPALPS